MHPGFKCLALFSPAIVLVFWATYLAANDQHMTEEMLIFLLLVLALSVVAAEIVRIQKRRRIMRKVKERDERPRL